VIGLDRYQTSQVCHDDAGSDKSKKLNISFTLPEKKSLWMSSMIRLLLPGLVYIIKSLNMYCTSSASATNPTSDIH
jgi:hypothetical protein